MHTYMDRIHEIYKSVGHFLEKGLADQGLNLIKHVTADIRDHVVIRYLNGVCQQESGASEMAEYYFRNVIHEDPGFVSAAEALLYMRDNMLSDGEKAYLCELIGMIKPETASLKEIRKSLAEITPEPLKLHEKPEEVSRILHSHSSTDQKEREKQPEPSKENPILHTITLEKTKSVSDSTRTSPEDMPAREESSYLGDILVDLKKKVSEKETRKPEMPQKDEEKESALDIHLSPEEEAEIEREEKLEERELLADSEEASKLKDLLKTLHERKHRDIEDQRPENLAETSNEENREMSGPFDTLTMARVYFKQGAYSSALRILGLLKKSTSDEKKLKEIESLMNKVREKIESEKAE